AGVGALEIGEMWDQPALGEGLERAHAQRPRGASADAVACAAQLAQRAPHRSEIAAAAARQLESGIEAAEKRDTELRFERLDLPADRRRGKAELPRRFLAAQ